MTALLLTLLLAATAGASAPVKFVLPRATAATASPRGIYLEVQVWVARNAANRSVEVRWDGESCGGAFTRPIEGEDGAQIFPDEPYPRVHVGQGVCTFVASVYDRAGKLRARAVHELEVQ